MFNFAQNQFIKMKDIRFNLSEKQKVIISNLMTLNDDQVISLIQDFRDSGELFIVQPLIEMLYSTRGKILKNYILEFVGDIKDQNAVGIIAQSIQKHITDKETTGLISACWQSNLDFSNEMSLFIDILCNGDYQNSFEAFTVIENSISNVTIEQIGLYIATIESCLKTTNAEKKLLLTDMILILESFKRNG
jgi:hypothetical protein